MRKRTPGFDNRALRVCRLLNANRVRYLVAGGVAANLHGSVRSTRDVDILVPRDVDNAAKLLTSLAALPFGLARELDAEEIVRKPVTIIGDDPRVDVLTVACSVTFEQAWPNHLSRRPGGIRVPYLALDDLIKSKQTGRASDLADIEVLRALAPRSKRR